jgi:hypothetical protein
VLGCALADVVVEETGVNFDAQASTALVNNTMPATRRALTRRE